MPPAFLFLAILVSAPPPPSADALREAEIQAKAAIASWKANAFADAAQHFLAAFELSGEPTQLRNAAKAFEAAGAQDDARAAWTRFLELSRLRAKDRREAEERVSALTPVTTTEAVAPPVVEAPAEVPAEVLAEVPAELPVEVVVEPPPAAPIRWKPWVLVGAGVAATAVGGVIWAVAAADLTDLRARAALLEDGKIVGVDYDVAVAEQRRIGGLRIGSALAMGTGIAAVLSGLAWWWFEW